MRRTDKHLRGAVEGEDIQNVAEAIFKKVMAKKFLEVVRCTNIQIQGDS